MSDTEQHHKHVAFEVNNMRLRQQTLVEAEKYLLEALDDALLRENIRAMASDDAAYLKILDAATTQQPQETLQKGACKAHCDLVLDTCKNQNASAFEKVSMFVSLKRLQYDHLKLLLDNASQSFSGLQVSLLMFEPVRANLALHLEKLNALFAAVGKQFVFQGRSKLNREPPQKTSQITNLETSTAFAIGQSHKAEVTTLLKIGNKKFMAMCDDIEQATNASIAKELFNEIYNELYAHLGAEEDVFYSQIKSLDGLLTSVHSGYKEHDEIKEFLEQLKEYSFDVTGDQTLFRKFKAALKEHIKKEEDAIFPGAARALGSELSILFADRFLEAKKQLTEQIQNQGHQEAG